MKTLYKNDSKSKIRIWTIEQSPDGSSYRSTTGLLDGKKITSLWTKCTPKNLGKSNEKSSVQQCTLEIKALVTKKKKQGYYSSIQDLKDSSPIFRPMLAKKYAGWEKLKVLKYVISQPKLDGIRCIINKDHMISRGNEIISTCSHIHEELVKSGIWEKNPSLILDGELYNHDFKDDFQTLVSYIKKERPETKEHVQFHCYDTYNPNLPNLTNNVRLPAFNLTGSFKYTKKVSSVIIFSENQLDEIYQKYIEEGYEGQMIRLDEAYEQKKSKNLLKRKEFQDEEFEILDVEEGKGNWSGVAKKIICKNSEGHKKETFKSGLKGDQTYAKKLLSEASKYIGGQATVRFFGRSDEGCPRFPVAVNLTFKDEKRL